MKIFLLKNIFLLSFISICINSFGQKSLPKSILIDLDGEIVNVRDVVSKDQITILSFWATWCYPCIKELDAIGILYEEWQEELNVELIAISVDDARPQKRIKTIIERKKWPYKFLLDKKKIEMLISSDNHVGIAKSIGLGIISFADVLLLIWLLFLVRARELRSLRSLH